MGEVGGNFIRRKEGAFMETIDLRSDTVTQPSQAMRNAMAEASVGDDVYGEDPTIRELEELGAFMAGKEAALFMTSGTQGNLGALLSLCSHGDGVILGEESHIYNYERGGLAAIGGFVPLVVPEAGGLPREESLFRWNRPEDVHFSPARVICLENTHNRGGGVAIAPERFSDLASKIHAQGLSIHLDGARLWNAATKYGVSIGAYTSGVDTVQLCLSKGLGAPGGSLLCGTREIVAKARNWRKMLGGGMRQAGILGAGGLYALKNNLALLGKDHRHAALLASLLRESGFAINEMSVWKARRLRVAEAGKPKFVWE